MRLPILTLALMLVLHAGPALSQEAPLPEVFDDEAPVAEPTEDALPPDASEEAFPIDAPEQEPPATQAADEDESSAEKNETS